MLQKSFGGDERNFLGPLMGFARRDVRDHIAYQKRTMELRIGPAGLCSAEKGEEIIFREIFEAVRFSSFCNSIGTYETCRRTSWHVRFAVKTGNRWPTAKMTRLTRTGDGPDHRLRRLCAISHSQLGRKMVA